MGDELYIDRDVGSMGAMGAMGAMGSTGAVGAMGATTSGLFSNAVDDLRGISADLSA